MDKKQYLDKYSQTPKCKGKKCTECNSGDCSTKKKLEVIMKSKKKIK